MQPPFIKHKKKETFNLKKEVFKYSRNWKWFLLCIALFLTAAFFYSRYSPVVYETTARIKIINQKQNEIELPGNLNSLFDDFKVNQENEVEIIKSYRILEKVVENLHLNVRYYSVNKIKTTQVWDLPIKVFSVDSLSFLPTSGEYFITFLKNGYSITDGNTRRWEIKTHQMNSIHQDLPFLLKLDRLGNISKLLNREFKIRFFNKREATLRLMSGLRIEQIGKHSEVLKLSLRNESSSKSEAVLNEIIAQFNQDGVKDRRLIFQRTIDFVDERFEFLTKELDSIESLKKTFKEKNNLTDIVLDTEHNLANKSNSNTEKTNLETQLEIARILKKSLLNKNNSKLLPADVGIGITGINDQIILYNKKIIEFRELKISGGSNNPVIINLKKNIDNLRLNILMSVIAYQKKAEAALKNIRRIDKKNKSYFHAIPKKEKILREIEREQSIKENLFIFLLQRREEAAINLVITAPTIKIVDYAITNLIPVSENPRILYAKAFVAGLVLPFVVFYLIFFIDTRIATKEDLYANVKNASLIGHIPYTKNKIFNGLNDGTKLAENFRILRTNIDFNIKDIKKENEASIIMVTSTKGREGKTHCAVNLAISYAALDKKVLLVETDFRNPQADFYLKNYNENGLSNYLKGLEPDLNKLIATNTIGETNLDVLFSGDLPKAPAELLSSDAVDDFIKLIKEQYDYVIFDTAPTELYTDTLLISKYADITIYVARSEYTNKNDLKYSDELIATEKLKNVNYILNYQETHSLIKNKKIRKRKGRA